MVADRAEWTAAMQRLNARVASIEAPTDATLLFEGRTTVLILRDRGDIALAASAHTTWIHLNWLSANRVVTRRELDEAFTELKDAAIARFGNLPFGGIFSSQCPYLVEHGEDKRFDVLASLKLLLVPDMVEVGRVDRLSFDVKDDSNRTIGVRMANGVYAHLLPEGHFGGLR